MRISTIGAFLALLLTHSVGFCADISITSTNELRFFVVSEKPVPGGRFIDTPELPRLGYISTTPNFVLTRLQKVWTNDLTSISLLDGKLSTNILSGVSISMFPTETESFSAFTRENIGRKVLLMLGDKPLNAPLVRTPIPNGIIQLPASFNNIVGDIQKLVPHK